jgi:hypothetical protein
MRSLCMASVVAVLTVAAGTHASAEMFVYPEKGQSKDQQEFDQFTCQKWAKEQTGIDPQLTAAPPPPPPQSGQAVHGAARGAAVGAIGGAIGGDAAKGAAIGAAVGGGAGVMRRRRAEMDYKESVTRTSQEQQERQKEFNRAYGVCLTGKGYKVG